MSLLDPTSQEPLYPLIIEGIGGAVNDGEEVDPSYYLAKDDEFATNDISTKNKAKDDDDAQLHRSKFWIEAHKLSCLKHGSFQSSIEVVYNDTMFSKLLDGVQCNDTAHNLDLVRKYIGESNICAYITSDGTALNNGNERSKDSYYRVAFCMRRINNTKALPSSSAARDHQMETIAQLSGVLLRGPAKQHWNVSSNQTQSSVAGSWFHYPSTIVSKISSVASYAIDKVLGDDAGDMPTNNWNDQTDEMAELDDASASLKDILSKGVTPKDLLDETEYDDATIVRNKLGSNNAAATVRREDQALGNTDEVISIELVAYTCQHLLEISQQLTLPDTSSEEDGTNCDFFTLSGHEQHGSVERIMLYKNGWGACSFGSFCKKAGRYYTPNQSTEASSYEKEKLKRLGKMLADITEREVDLLASTLTKSNYAIIENDIITVFPGGIPADFEPCQSDHALFQIHVTKITIQCRMTRLEQDANAAKQNAVRAQRNNMTKLALVHMRRRKAALEELDRCASILTNLDASEIRLERAKNDVQVVQSYKLLKTALQDVRKTSNVDNENVEELMLDIRSEIEEMGDLGREAIYPEESIDEDELNEEFLKLELECENEEAVESDVKDDIDRNQECDELDAQQPTIMQQNNEDPEVSKEDEAVLA